MSSPTRKGTRIYATYSLTFDSETLAKHFGLSVCHFASREVCVSTADPGIRHSALSDQYYILNSLQSFMDAFRSFPW